MVAEAPAPEEQPADWNDEEDGDLGRVSSTQEADLPPEREDFRVSFEEEEDEEEEVVTGVLDGRQEEAEGDDQGIEIPEGAVGAVTGRNAIDTMETDDGIGDLDQEPVIPGLSSASAAPSTVHGVNGGEEKVSRSDDLDSDSEDDLQIVLNDDNVGHFGGNRNRVAGVEDEDDEDGEEDLVIVTDEDQHHHHQVMEEQEWGDELMQQGVDGESNEALDSKVNGGIGARIGYVSHGFHGQHHSQYKYIRPGAAAMAGGAAVGSGPPPGQVRPHAMGPMVGRPRGMQKGFHSGYGLSGWAGGASGRAYGSGLEFTLPSHKTIFDVDIDGFDEKPWKLPGIDISDFFNFGLDEDSWRDHRKQLEQLRLEATMQSKIRVYESGRSEQDYDPDLPPELAAATGVQDIYAGKSQLGKTDGGQADLIVPGRGAMRSQQQLPTGRAIQVESGYGERLPSIDTRPPRIRDSDAIIEIVLQESIDDSTTSNEPLDQQPYQCEKQELKGANKVEDCDRAADSQHFDCSPSYGGRKREVKNGSMGSVGGNVIEGNGILPSPSDMPMQYHSNSKSRSPIYAGDLQSASRAARWTKESSRERHSHANDQNPNDAAARQSDKLQVDDDQKEKSEGSAEEAKGISQMSPSAPLESAGVVILEEGGSDQNDHPFLDDITDIEDKEKAPNLPLLDETLGDIESLHTVKKQKLTSRVEQPVSQVDGIDSRVTHSDDSRAKSGSSKDYMKRREGGEEEVVQRRRGKQIGDVERHHDDDKRNSSQRKDDHGHDGTHEIERSRIPSKGREDIPQFQQHQEVRPAHYERRGHGVERVKERDGSFGGRQRREDDAYGRRGKDEDAKRDQQKEIELRHKNKVMGTEKKGKDEDPHSRRHDDGKGHHYRDGTTRQRDREDSLMSRREPSDDLHVKRKKDEEQRRREKVSKEDSQHGYRSREDGSHGKRERDDGTDHRRREDQPRVRDKPENHHSIRHRDENWRQREREDRLRFKQPREDTQKHKEREEGRSIVRTGRVLEEKTTGGSGSKAADTYPPKDRRRHGDQHRRVERSEEHTRPEHHVHEELHTRDYQLSRKEKNSRHERLISHSDHSLISSDGEKMHRERSRKRKEIEVREPNIATGKRKLEDNNSNQSEKGGLARTNDHEGNNTSHGLHSQKGHQLNDEPPDIHGQNRSSENHEEHVASDDDIHVRKGRSKLERWTSHKERDYINSSIHSLSSSSKVGEIEVNNDDISQHDELSKNEDNNILDSDVKGMEVTQESDMTGKESDRHLDTVAKLKKRSERFKLPMPGDKETAMPRKSENETSLVQSETVTDADIKHERPARKRRWSSS